ncbi:hypothetical protein SRHO_G00095980 [Serrasalmus rhombeus]
MCGTADSRKSDMKYVRPGNQSIISLDASGTQTLLHVQEHNQSLGDSEIQKLTVVVEDNGQPSRSATVNINVAVADSFPEVLSEFTDFTHDKDYNDNLTFYLVLALAVVSFLFIVSIIAILSVKCYRWRRERMFYKSGANLPVIPYYPPLYADVGGTGTLQHVYNYELCGTADSRKSDMKFVRSSSQSVLSVDLGGTRTVPRQNKHAVDPDVDVEVCIGFARGT